MDAIGFKTDKSEIDRLFLLSAIRIKNTKLTEVRYLYNYLNWEDRFICLTGARGSGKTTLILQYIKNNFTLNQAVIYVSVDDIYFTNHRLIDFADDFVAHGGEFLFLDEVHKYPTWSIELKTIYDVYPGLKIVFTGSSILEVYKGNADLSRRLVSYSLEGLSFREFLNFEYNLSLEPIALVDILSNHTEIAADLAQKVKLLPAFKNYLHYGYYPYYLEGKTSYGQKLANTVNLIIETDIPAVNNIEYKNVYKLKKLMHYLAASGPFKPDITKLSAQIEVSRNTLLLFLNYLTAARLINLLKTDKTSDSMLAKPEKVYVNNVNLIYALIGNIENAGNAREIFFHNQMAAKNKVHYALKGDFLINGKYTFEVGGKNKNFTQVKDIKNSFIAADDLEIGIANKIPLWLLGFTY